MESDPDLNTDLKDKRTADAFAGKYGKGFPSDLIKRTRILLTVLQAATALDDLKTPNDNHLEALKGDRAGQHSVRINDQWRICFCWTPAGPEQVEIVDYH